jgi:hypothetical protein
MTLGRRPLFFLVVALVCLVLVPATPAEFRWVNLAMAGLATFWCLMLAGEDLARRRRRPPSGPDARH